MPFIITQNSNSWSTREMRVAGFSPAEIDELGSMDHREMTDKVLELLNTRNRGIGTVWHNGYGVYGVRIDPGIPDSVFVTIGTSCD